MGREIYSKYLKKRKKYFVLLVLVIGVGVGLNALPPYVFGKIIDLISLKERARFFQWLVVYVIILLAVQMLSTLEILLGQWLVSTVENDVKSRLMERIIYMRNSEVDNYERGELLNRLELDVETIVDYYIDLVSSILMIVINFMISLYFILRISIKLSVVAIVFFPLLYLVNYAFRHRVRRLEKQQKEINDRYYSFVNATFDNLNPIKAFSIQADLSGRFIEFLAKKLNIEMKTVRLKAGVSVFRAFLTNALDIILLTAAGMFIMADKLTVGNMVAFNSYQGKLFEAVSKILELNLNRQSVLISYERIQRIENELLETDHDGKIAMSGPIEKIELKNVTFFYKKNMVINQIEMCLEEPGLYSIVGENGCGKTTILKLLERFYDTVSGEVLLNGTDINQYQIITVRNQMSYMAKESFFIVDTIYNNIRLGNHAASNESIEDVCRRVGIHHDIMEMEWQYRTILQEGGKNLSSGQKQKLGIARLLLRHSSVCLLDEVTSDLDGAAEKNVCNLIEDMARNAIVLNVSHKEECLKRSKRIMVMARGMIIAEGTHETLLESCTLYRKLFK